MLCLVKPTLRRGRSSITVALAAALVLGVLGPVTLAGASSNVSSSQLQGSDRYATAGLVAQAKFPSGVGTAVVASGLNYPDALAGAYLAGVDHAAILLTDPLSVPSALSNALSSLRVANVILLGGTDAISQAVQSALSSTPSTSATGGNLNVTRIAGATRYDTMNDVDSTPGAGPVAVVTGKRTAIIASGASFPDALAASGAAYGKQIPIVLTDPNTLSPQAQAILTALGIQQVLIMGATAAISAGVEQAINAMGIPTAARFAGTDRTDTAQQFATYSVSTLGFTNSEIVLVRGDAFPDALVGSQYAGDPKPMLLGEDQNNLGPFDPAYFGHNGGSINKITGLGAVSTTELEAAVGDAESGSTTTTTPTTTATTVASTSTPSSGGGATISSCGSTCNPGGTLTGSHPTTGGPDLESTTVESNNFLTGSTTVLRYTFDKALNPCTAAPCNTGGGTDIIGYPTDIASNGATGTHPTSCASAGGDPSSIDCTFPNTVNVASFTIAVVNSGTVTASVGSQPNPMGSVPNSGYSSNTSCSSGSVCGFPGPLLTTATVVPGSNPLQVTYTFNQSPLSGVTATKFGLVESGGQEYVGASATGTGPVTVTFASGVTNSSATFFALANAVSGPQGAPIANPPTTPNEAAVSNSNRPNLTGVARTSTANQFTFTFDKTITATTAADFLLFSSRDGSAVAGNALVSAPSSNSETVGFPTVTVANQSLYTLAGVTDTCAGSGTCTAGAVTSAATSGTANTVASFGITGTLSGGQTVAAGGSAGPVVSSITCNAGTNTVTYTFSSSTISHGSETSGDFFVIDNGDNASFGTAITGDTSSSVTVTFASHSPLATMVGAGIASPFGTEPGANTTAVLDTNGNNNAPGDLPATACTS